MLGGRIRFACLCLSLVSSPLSPTPSKENNISNAHNPTLPHYRYKTKNSLALSVYAAVVASGYIFPSSYSGSPGLKDFYMRYIFLPFKASQRRFKHLPDKSNPGIVLYHPHGMFSWGFMNGGAYNNFYYKQGFQGLVAASLLHAPGFRLLFVKLLGGINSAEKDELVKKMKGRESFGLIPGGFHEATISYPDNSRVFLKRRKGFVKYALQHGFSLIPVYTYGESATYWNASGLFSLRWWFNDQKLPAILPFGRWWCPLLPRSVELNTIGGEPLKLPKIEKPTLNDVNIWHDAYMQHLARHFETHKKEFGGVEANNKLEIW